MMYNGRKVLRGEAMLFRKRIPRSCGYCRFGTKLENDQILCTKYGVVSVFYACGKYKYDPCKRIPPKPKALDPDRFKDTDFSL